MFKYLFLITALLVIGFTSLVSIPGSPYLIGGMTQADISAIFATAITPAGVTFAIWSVIYLSWIVAGAVVAGLSLTPLTKKLLNKDKNSPSRLAGSPLHRGAILAFSLAIALTAVWLVPWGNIWIGTALIVMIAILVLLAYTFSRTREANIIVRSSIHLTFAWIIMATALNITVWMRYMNLPLGGVGDVYYAIFALGIVLLVVSELQCRYKSYIISGVFLWTLLWVYIAHPILEIRVAVIIYAITISIYIIQFLRNKKTSLSSLKFW